MNKALSEYKRVRRFALSFDELPKNSTRKILYNEVKSLLEQGMYQADENDGAVHHFKSGAAYLAKNLEKKIIPLSVNGAYAIWPRQRKLPALFSGLRRYARAGKPIDPAEYDSVDALNEAVEKAVKDMVVSGQASSPTIKTC